MRHFRLWNVQLAVVLSIASHICAQGKIASTHPAIQHADFPPTFGSPSVTFGSKFPTPARPRREKRALGLVLLKARCEETDVATRL